MAGKMKFVPQRRWNFHGKLFHIPQSTTQPFANTMEKTSIHKVSEHLKDRLPYCESFPRVLDPDAVSLPLLDRGITKQSELLQREGLDDTKRLEVLRNLLGLMSDSENKMKFLTEPNLLDSVVKLIDPETACSADVRVAAVRLITRMCTAVQTIAALISHHSYIFNTLGALLAFKNGEEEEIADIRLAVSECFSVLSSSRVGWSAVTQSGEDLLSVLISDGLRKEKISPDKTRESIGLILDSLCRLARQSPDTIEILLRHGVVPAALEFLPRPEQSPASDIGGKLDDWLREHIDQETTLIGALSLLHSLAAHHEGQMDIVDHKAIYFLSPIIVICLRVLREVEAVDREYAETVLQALSESIAIILLSITDLEGKKLLVSADENENPKFESAMDPVLSALKLLQKGGEIEENISKKVASDVWYSDLYGSVLLVGQNLQSIMNSLAEWPFARPLINKI